jgi:acetate kinase
MTLLTLNAGSSSLKYKLFDEVTLNSICHGVIDELNQAKGVWLHSENGQTTKVEHHFSSHKNALQQLTIKLTSIEACQQISAIGHRVVHGGAQFKSAQIIDANVIDAIKACIPLAPLHNPVNLACIEYAKAYYKNALHVAIFDTAFHQTMPDHVYTYPIDREIADKHYIRKYGFHGSNHHYVAQIAAKSLDKPLGKCAFISLHLGNGASSCLIIDGKSFDTSMGLTPLAGLMMGTRCGDVDPYIPLFLQKTGMRIDDVDALLNKQSGLKGIANESDMREIERRLKKNDKLAKLAMKMYAYKIQQIIGAYYTQIKTLDGIIFTGGIGENSSILRQLVIEKLTHLNLHLDKLKNESKVDSCTTIHKTGTSIFVIKGDEEYYMATIVQQLLDKL